MTEVATTSPPTVGNIVAAAAAADREQQRLQFEREEQDRIRLVTKATEHVARLLGLPSGDNLLTVTLGNSQADAGTTITYTPPGDPENPIHFLWHPFVTRGMFEGYTEEHVTILTPCQSCGALVAAHDPSYWPSDLVSLGRLLMVEWDDKNDPAHHENCPKAWREEDEPKRPEPPKPTIDDLLLRLAQSVEAIADRMPS